MAPSLSLIAIPPMESAVRLPACLLSRPPPRLEEEQSKQNQQHKQQNKWPPSKKFSFATSQSQSTSSDDLEAASKFQWVGCFLSLTILLSATKPANSIAFDGGSSPQIWITVSSLVNKDPNYAKSLLFRQIEINWLNAPLEDSNEYIGLYLDSQPDENALPVSVHRLNGQTSGHILTDYYLPKIDFYNQTSASSTDGPAELISYANEATFEQPTVRFRSAKNRFGGGRLNPQQLEDSVQRRRSPQQGRLLDECIGYCIAYHSRNKIVAKNCLRIQPNWMQNSFQYIGARSLPFLMIPGTHNSGTYPKHLDKTVLQMINKYQMNQDESIFNQLVFGIRHLDLRVGFAKVKQRPERLWIYHDIFRTEVSVDEVLEQVKRFLDLTSHEIVVMDFHRFTVGFQNEKESVQRERHAKLIELIFKQLGDYIVPSYFGQHAPVNEYVAMGKRLIVGYASRSSLLGSQGEHNSMFGLLREASSNNKSPQVRDIDAIKQDYEDYTMVGQQNATATTALTNSDQQHTGETVDRRMGTRIFNKLKSLKLISNSFSKRSSPEANKQVGGNSHKLSLFPSARSEPEAEPTSAAASEQERESHLAKVALFFPPVRHLWPNQDTIEGLAQYMNETTCRKYFGELRSMMVELTPTVFGAISDKYDGNRRLAQLVNRQVTDWIRDRWLHCINIVSSDYFLGNDLIRLSIYANKMRLLHKNVDLNEQGECKSFRHVEHLLDKSKIPTQLTYQQISRFYSPELGDEPGDSFNDFGSQISARGLPQDTSDLITHTSSNGDQILLKPLNTNNHRQDPHWAPREKRDSFVDNVSDGFSDLISSFKRFFNL